MQALPLRLMPKSIPQMPSITVQVSRAIQPILYPIQQPMLQLQRMKSIQPKPPIIPSHQARDRPWVGIPRLV